MIFSSFQNEFSPPPVDFLKNILYLLNKKFWNSSLTSNVIALELGPSDTAGEDIIKESKSVESEFMKLFLKTYNEDKASNRSIFRSASHPQVNRWAEFYELINDLKKTHLTRSSRVSYSRATGYRRWNVVSKVLQLSDQQVNELDMDHLETAIVSRMIKLYPNAVKTVETDTCDSLHLKKKLT